MVPEYTSSLGLLHCFEYVRAEFPRRDTGYRRNYRQLEQRNLPLAFFHAVHLDGRNTDQACRMFKRRWGKRLPPMYELFHDRYLP